MQKGRGKTLTGLFDTVTAERITDIGDSESVETVEASDLGLDQVFEILKNQRRRYVLQYLRAVDGQVTLSDLSEQIAAWENDKEVRQITSSERKRVYVGLYQCHLPKMDGMDVVSFNKPRAIIEPGENIELLYRYLDRPGAQSNRTWSRWYVSLSVITVAALVAATLVETMATIPATSIVTGASLIAFASVALVHYQTERDEFTGSAGADRLELSADQMQS